MSTTSQNTKQVRFAFFGTDEFAVLVLEELKRRGLIPGLIVTTEDKPQGKRLTVMPPPVKVWAMANEIEYAQQAPSNKGFQEYLDKREWDVFLVASYGSIIPKNVLDIPEHGSLNIHPSLLPKLRGASPIQNAILYEDVTGVTLMQMDEKMDHGPIIVQKKVPTEEWPMKKVFLEAILARAGAELFAETLPDWLAGSIAPQDQNHENATFTKKIQKEDALINFDDDPEWNYRKVHAFHEWPRTYCFAEKNGKQVRTVITDAEFTDSAFVIKRVIPEGKNEMSFEDFTHGGYTVPGYDA